MTDSLPDTSQNLSEKKLVPIGEACEILGVSIDTIRRWDKSGILHSSRPDGKTRYFSLDELEKVKFSKSLSIGDASKQLGVSPSTLRRLEEKGLIAPNRNNAGERTYSLDVLKEFLRSDYFLIQKHIEEEILEPLKSPEEREELREENEKALISPAETKVLISKVASNTEQIESAKEQLTETQKRVEEVINVASLTESKVSEVSAKTKEVAQIAEEAVLKSEIYVKDAASAKESVEKVTGEVEKVSAFRQAFFKSSLFIGTTLSLLVIIIAVFFIFLPHEASHFFC